MRNANFVLTTSKHATPRIGTAATAAYQLRKGEGVQCVAGCQTNQRASSEEDDSAASSTLPPALEYHDLPLKTARDTSHK